MHVSDGDACHNKTQYDGSIQFKQVSNHRDAPVFLLYNALGIK